MLLPFEYFAYLSCIGVKAIDETLCTYMHTFLFPYSGLLTNGYHIVFICCFLCLSLTSLQLQKFSILIEFLTLNNCFFKLQIV